MNAQKILNPNRIFVIGYMGSNQRDHAEKLAGEKGFLHINLDDEIEAADGRSVKRICMMMGEHEYRNKEYEALQKICTRSGIVVSCGDGVVLDEQSLDILCREAVLFLNEPLDVLWERARNDSSTPYAFMSGADESAKYKKFCSLYESRILMYNKCIE